VPIIPYHSNNLSKPTFNKHKKYFKYFQNLLVSIFDDKVDLILISAVAFILGAIFFIFNYSFFTANTNHALILLVSSIFGFYIFYNSYVRNIYAILAIIIIGSFYCFFYGKLFVNHNEINSRIYVIAQGKVESLKNYKNSKNNTAGIKVTLSDISFENSPYVSSKKRRSLAPEVTKKKIIKYFANVDGYQELDRGNIDLQRQYQQINWQKADGRLLYPNPPQKISFIIRNNYIKDKIDINDIIRFKSMISNDYQKELPSDFDLDTYNKMKKIGGFGFAISNVEIIKKSQIDNINSWFLNLRSKISQRIINILPKEQSSIALALLVGDKSYISKDDLAHIRNSGLAHLLSISGFHMALAGAIFFTTIRFLLSRNEYLTLKFNIKKLSAILALIACFFYLNISGSLIPAQRAFLIIILAFLAFLFSEKINLIRSLAIIAIIMTLINPYNASSIGFQLSFIAVLTIITICRTNNSYTKSFGAKAALYSKNILITSAIIQILTMPFLLHAFGKFSILSPLANILAIPLTSFIIMPIGFLSLFLMPLNLDKFTLPIMGQGINCINYIASTISNIDYSYITTPKLSGIALLISFIGIILISLKSRLLKLIGIILFTAPLLTVISDKQYDISFDNEQKFFATYDKENGLIFSKKIRQSKQKDKWLEYFQEDNFKYRQDCKSSCIIEVKGKKFYIITARSKISEICQEKNYDVIVNLNPKYKLPICIKNKKYIKKIDNIDFYQKGGHFINITNNKILIDYTRW